MSDKQKKKEKTYGTSGGVVLTDAVLDELVAEAEAGYDLSKLRPRGRPPIGSEATTVLQLRLDPELRHALHKRAEIEGTTPSELAHRLLRAQLAPGTDRRKRHEE